MIFSLVSGSLARLCPTPPLSPPCPRLPSRPPSPPHSRPVLYIYLHLSLSLTIYSSLISLHPPLKLLTQPSHFHNTFLPPPKLSPPLPSLLLPCSSQSKLLFQLLHLLLPPLTFSLHVAPPCPSIASLPISFLHFVLHPLLHLRSISRSSAGVTTLNLSPARRLNPHNRI